MLWNSIIESKTNFIFKQTEKFVPFYVSKRLSILLKIQ